MSRYVVARAKSNSTKSNKNVKYKDFPRFTVEAINALEALSKAKKQFPRINAFAVLYEEDAPKEYKRDVLNTPATFVSNIRDVKYTWTKDGLNVNK